MTYSLNKVNQFYKKDDNIIMLDPDRKHTAFSSRASHQLREIQYNCRQVVAMSKYLNALSGEIADSEVNSRKIEIFKTQIKQKLKEFAVNVDEIYKILDRKIMVILAEIKKVENKENKANTSKPNSICSKCNGRPAKVEEEGEKLTNSQTEKMFSDTLNPRITHLEAKINQYQANQARLKKKITELTNKNQAILEEFNRLSTASNKKINELTSKISKDSFSSDYEVFNQSPNKAALSFPAPMLASPAKPKKSNPANFQSEQFSYQLSNQLSYTSQPFYKEQKSNLLNFGCMPSRLPKSSSNPLGISNVSESYEKLDRNDKNRRFDLLLNKLRNSQQESTDQSHSEELRMAREQPGSVFSQNIVQRYQI